MHLIGMIGMIDERKVGMREERLWPFRRSQISIDKSDPKRPHKAATKRTFSTDSLAGEQK